MEAKYPEITMMETVCVKLKRLQHPDTPWIACYKVIGHKLTKLKKLMRIYHPDKTDHERFSLLRQFTDADIKEAFAMVDKPNETRDNPAPKKP